MLQTLAEFCCAWVSNCDMEGCAVVLRSRFESRRLPQSAVVTNRTTGDAGSISCALFTWILWLLFGYRE